MTGPARAFGAALGIPLELSEFALDFLAAAGPALPDAAEDVGQAWADPSALQSGIVLGVFMPLPGARTAMALLASPSACERLLHAPPSAFYMKPPMQLNTNEGGFIHTEAPVVTRHQMRPAVLIQRVFRMVHSPSMVLFIRGRIYEAAARLSPRCRALAERYRFPEDFTHIRRPFGHAARYVDDAAVLMGDAAHPVTPAGGQGANMSVADALALADVVQQALPLNDCSRLRLEPYQTIRRPANERSLQFSVRTDRVFRTLQRHPWMATLFPTSLAFVNRSRTLKARLIRAVSQAFASAPPAA